MLFYMTFLGAVRATYITRYNVEHGIQQRRCGRLALLPRQDAAQPRCLVSECHRPDFIHLKHSEVTATELAFALADVL